MPPPVFKTADELTLYLLDKAPLRVVSVIRRTTEMDIASYYETARAASGTKLGNKKLDLDLLFEQDPRNAKTWERAIKQANRKERFK